MPTLEIACGYAAPVPPPLAYFLTWTTYGTRLHGDIRGSVGALNRQRGQPAIAPDPQLEAAERQLMRQPEYIMDDKARSVVDRAIRDHAEIRRWRIHAVNVRTNHVHILVTCPEYTPETVMAQFKGWGTRRLRAAGLIGPDRQVWTDHGSTRWINHEVGFVEAITYVPNGQ